MYPCMHNRCLWKWTEGFHPKNWQAAPTQCVPWLGKLLLLFLEYGQAPHLFNPQKTNVCHVSWYVQRQKSMTQQNTERHDLQSTMCKKGQTNSRRQNFTKKLHSMKNQKWQKTHVNQRGVLKVEGIAAKKGAQKDCSPLASSNARNKVNLRKIHPVNLISGLVPA